ncbi:PP2C family protein-serine/threonine phosphatase [Nonomuraea sp. SYSU D8015]|uniref:PP2C family protein-serine/threonine phosphatase n=1 Tax=Nonomuraea sp. SYSU D8015 TaxID=2593644 RepID=UPI0016604E22|nr:protein phosphatase 2C domain-containing protein [Nonomuraea sp. SYSU D8015]
MTETTGCVACEGGAVAPDGRCWDCGAAQPGFRSHLEITASDGAAGVSDRGLRRGVNADAMALATVGAWTAGVVCDGVSMSPRPERAAQVAAEAGVTALAAGLRAGLLPEDALTSAAMRASRAVSALAAPPLDAPACTYVAGIAGPEGIWTCWIGDSRAYWLPDEGVGMALTEDDVGEHDALAAWLGADAGEPEPRIRGYRPHGPGLLLLCTDGLWRHLPDPDALRDHSAPHRRPAPRHHDALHEHSDLHGRGNGPEHGEGLGNGEGPGNGAAYGHGGLLQGARSLVGYALDAGGQDNVTALLIPVAGPRCRRG